MQRLTINGSGPISKYFIVVKGSAAEISAGASESDQFVVPWGPDHHIICGVVADSTDAYDVDTVIKFDTGGASASYQLDGQRASPQEIIQMTGGEGLPLPNRVPQPDPGPGPGPSPRPESPSLERMARDPVTWIGPAAFVLMEVEKSMTLLERRNP